jgi:hypothetical protein
MHNGRKNGEKKTGGAKEKLVRRKKKKATPETKGNCLAQIGRIGWPQPHPSSGFEKFAATEESHT